MSRLITEKKFLIDVPEGKRKERIDTFLTHHIENITRSKVQKAVDAGLVTVNGIVVKSNYNVKPSDKVEATQIISPRPEDVEAEEIPLDIVYEDDYFLIVNKAAGMVAHPAYANYTGTLVNALLHHTKSLSSDNEGGRPGIVHRIDKDTSGLLVVAKDDYTHAKLAAQFSRHSIEREYHAICWGKFKDKEGEINSKITRSKSDRKKFTTSDKEGKDAITFYKVIDQYEFTSYIKLNLKTGRTHQIRVHLSGLGKPIFGDHTYGGNKIHAGVESPKLRSRVQNLLEIMPRQALHAKTLGFIHPHTNKLVRFDSDLPDDFKLLLEKLRT
jgi:23S rRNA pseudouridine1911/1915/1917 synthase